MIGSLKYTRAALAFMAILLVFLLILDNLIYSWERKVLFEEYHNQSQNELELIGTFVTEPILRHDFTIVEQFMIHWGELKKDVISLKAFTPDGSLLAEYNNSINNTRSFTKFYPVIFLGQHLLDLELTKDLSPVTLHLQDFKQRLISQSILLTIFIGILLWFVLRILAIKPLETEIIKRKQAEENLQKANDRLEELVAERTRELRKANIELHNEIYEKYKMQEEKKKTSISKGDIVRLKDMDSTGEVLEVNEKSVLVAFGNMITKGILQENISTLWKAIRVPARSILIPLP